MEAMLKLGGGIVYGNKREKKKSDFIRSVLDEYTVVCCDNIFFQLAIGYLAKKWVGTTQQRWIKIYPPALFLYS
jgi:hypothetical protein